MHSSPHRNNSGFQIKYFIAGSCYTADGAWSLLYNLQNERSSTIVACEAQKLRREAKILEANNIIASEYSTEIEKLNAKADLIEQDATLFTWEMNVKAAKLELEDIENLMKELNPLRLYSHLPILEAFEAGQRAEWLGELKARAENSLITTGAIDTELLKTLRMHPDFECEIVPCIQNLLEKLSKITSPFEGLEMLKNNQLVLDKK